MAKSLTFSIERELNEADLALLDAPRDIKPPSLIRLKDSHHALAKALAQGKRPAECQVLTGYSPSRISILQADPSFQELMAFYRGREEEIADAAIQRIRTASMDILAGMLEDLEVHPENWSAGTQVELFKVCADRCGLGPQSKTTSVNINLDLAGRLERARARVIDHVPLDAE